MADTSNVGTSDDESNESWENYPLDFLIKSDILGLDEDYCGWSDCKLCRVIKCMIRNDPKYSVSTRFCSKTHLIYILAHRDIHYVGITTIPLRYCLRQIRDAIDCGESQEEKLVHYYRYRDITSADIIVIDYGDTLNQLIQKANQYMKQWGAVDYGLNMSYMKEGQQLPFCNDPSTLATSSYSDSSDSIISKRDKHKLWIPSAKDKKPSVEIPVPAMLGGASLIEK